jgi:hypothetical protein
MDQTPLPEEEARTLSKEAHKRAYDRMFLEQPELFEALKRSMKPKTRADFQRGITVLAATGEAWAEALAKLLVTFDALQEMHPTTKPFFQKLIREMKNTMTGTVEEGTKKFAGMFSTPEGENEDTE